MELFAGSNRFSQRLLARGAPWVLVYDLATNPRADLAERVVQGEVEDLLRSGAVASVGAAPPCSSLSRAVHPPWRSHQFPAGYPWLRGRQRAKVRAGNKSALWILKVAKICLEMGIALWVENPFLSCVWSFRPWRQFLLQHFHKDLIADP